MLTRLHIKGFKNLVDVDIRFGPFTCIAGANGVGKSNLFDAIAFLSALSEKPLIDAALSVRDEGGKTGDIRSLFHRVADDFDNEMSFEAEMIIPEHGFDDLGQPAEATSTFLKYFLALRYRQDEGQRAVGGLEIIEEKLTHIKQREAKKQIPFTKSTVWKNSVIYGKRGTPFISTEGDTLGSRTIKIHQDGTSGRTRAVLAKTLPRTVISATNAAETPTATLVRREMQSWRLLQLEPSSLRAPDPFTSPTRLGSDGSNLAATLYRMGRIKDADAPASNSSRGNSVYAKVANRLAELIDDVRELRIDRDENRELLTLFVSGKDGTAHPARALSDGTLRFLALAVLELDPDSQGVLCLEEPENGIHPKRIPFILNLLRDISVNTDEEVGADNPLRQVIINTHSPEVVKQVQDNSLLIAELKQVSNSNKSYSVLSFSCLPDTWRADIPEAEIVQRGRVLEYLNPTPGANEATEQSTSPTSKPVRLVKDRKDMQLPFPFSNNE